jgi:hypothetical protein
LKIKFGRVFELPVDARSFEIEFGFFRIDDPWLCLLGKGDVRGRTE